MLDTQSIKQYPIVIIGAGPVGLTAAHELAKQHMQPIVIDQADKVGRISRTDTYKGYRFDIGGHLFYTKVAKVEQFWQEILEDDFMAGGTDAHITIPLNLWALLRGNLSNSGCRAYALDMKVQIEDLNCFYYPDVMVTCGDRNLASTIFKHYPCLIETDGSATRSDRTQFIKPNGILRLSQFDWYLFCPQTP